MIWHSCRALLGALLVAVPAVAQAPHEAWRTVRTAHFRVHYPEASEQWAHHAARQLDAVRSAVVEVVGYAPREVIDVVVMDPVARPNGLALPMLRAPRMVLWTSPPPPHSVLGQYRDWAELVAVHETTHLVHLMRPSRHPLSAALSVMVPVGPIPLQAPRWVVEGYATLVEGQLTGAGRPLSDLRAALLRRRAQRGELPSYAELSWDSGSWYGTSMAYLAGSAYLEWLVERAGPDSLRHLWARMTARQRRTFEQAFSGVFGDDPGVLYNRFTAELTYRAMEAEHRITPVLHEGELWQDLGWTTGAPQLSPDGELLAIVRRSRDRPSELVVWTTAARPELEESWREEQADLVERDPQDVPAVLPRPLARDPEYRLVTHNRAEPYTPRFMPDGRSLLYVRYEPDGHGFLHPDLFRWELASGRTERLTRGADVREPDPAPDGRWAVAVRHRHGLSGLVRVDLTSGQVSELGEPSVQRVVAWPRVSPNGQRVVFVRLEGGRWRLIVHDLVEHGEVELPTPEAAVVAHPAWSADGTSVYASIGGAGFVDAHRFSADGSGEPTAVTRTHGGALAPAPTPDGEALFFLSLEADGLDLRRVALARPPVQLPAVHLPEELVPAVPAPAPTVSDRAAGVLGLPEHYGAGRLELSAVAGGRLAPAGYELEAGVRAGDLLGRLELLAVGAVAIGGSGTGGGVVSGTWRGWPVEVGGAVAATTERPSDQPREVPGLGTSRDLDRLSGEARAWWGRRWRGGGLGLDGGLLLSSVRPVDGDPYEQLAADVTAALEQGFEVHPWRFGGGVEVGWQAGDSGVGGWSRGGGRVHLDLAYRSVALNLVWQGRGSSGELRDQDRFALGGLEGTLEPSGVTWGRVAEPALPVGTMIGDQAESLHGQLQVGPLPLRYSRHRLWSDGEARGRWLDLVAVGYHWELGPWPLLRLPACRIDVGVAHILDEPFENVTEWWLGVAWRP